MSLAILGSKGKGEGTYMFGIPHSDNAYLWLCEPQAMHLKPTAQNTVNLRGTERRKA